MARLRNQTSERLHFAGQFTQGETRHVILATDRPIAMGEARRNTRSLDNNVPIIKLELDADGNGEGTFIVGAEVAFDGETETLEITHASTQPVRLTRVRRRN